MEWSCGPGRHNATWCRTAHFTQSIPAQTRECLLRPARKKAPAGGKAGDDEIWTSNLYYHFVDKHDRPFIAFFFRCPAKRSANAKDRFQRVNAFFSRTETA
jgi:hypothetical protein